MSSENPVQGFTQCPDGHRCFNGSLCTENPYDEGSYYCDCDESFLNDAVSGLSCEHVATDYCTFNNEISMTSFCTNNGTCQAQVGVEDAHLGCNCPPDYEGEHCQFVKGSTIPNNWPGGGGTVNWGSNESNEKLKGGVTAVIVLICLGLVGVVGYFFVYKKQRRSTGGSVISSPELALEADGEILQKAVRAGVHNNGSGGMGSPEFEIDPDGDVLKEAIASKSPTSSGSTVEGVNIVSPSSASGDEEEHDRDANGGIV